MLDYPIYRLCGHFIYEIPLSLIRCHIRNYSKHAEHLLQNIAVAILDIS